MTDDLGNWIGITIFFGGIALVAFVIWRYG